MLFQGRFWYGVDEAGTYYPDSGFHAHCDVLRLWISVEGTLRDFYLGIDKLVLLAVRELHRQSAFHGCHLMPFHVDLILVYRRQEWRYGLRLWHAGHFAYVRPVIAVVAVNGIIYHEQISVAIVSGFVCVLSFTVAVAGVAVDAGCAHGCRAETIEWWCCQCDIALEEHFAEVEVVYESLIVYGWSLVLVAPGLYVLRGAKSSTGIPFVFCEIADGFSYIAVVVALPHVAEIFGVVGAGYCRKTCTCGQKEDACFRRILHSQCDLNLYVCILSETMPDRVYLSAWINVVCYCLSLL